MNLRKPMKVSKQKVVMTLDFKTDPKVKKGMRIEVEGKVYIVDCCVNLKLVGFSGFRLFLTKE